MGSPSDGRVDDKSTALLWRARHGTKSRCSARRKRVLLPACYQPSTRVAVSGTRSQSGSPPATRSRTRAVGQVIRAAKVPASRVWSSSKVADLERFIVRPPVSWVRRSSSACEPLGDTLGVGRPTVTTRRTRPRSALRARDPTGGRSGRVPRARGSGRGGLPSRRASSLRRRRARSRTRPASASAQ